MTSVMLFVIMVPHDLSFNYQFYVISYHDLVLHDLTFHQWIYVIGYQGPNY